MCLTIYHMVLRAPLPGGGHSATAHTHPSLPQVVCQELDSIAKLVGENWEQEGEGTAEAEGRASQ